MSKIELLKKIRQGLYTFFLYCALFIITYTIEFAIFMTIDENNIPVNILLYIDLLILLCIILHNAYLSKKINYNNFVKKIIKYLINFVVLVVLSFPTSQFVAIISYTIGIDAPFFIYCLISFPILILLIKYAKKIKAAQKKNTLGFNTDGIYNAIYCLL